MTSSWSRSAVRIKGKDDDCKLDGVRKIQIQCKMACGVYENTSPRRGIRTSAIGAFGDRPRVIVTPTPSTSFVLAPRIWEVGASEAINCVDIYDDRVPMLQCGFVGLVSTMRLAADRSLVSS